MHKKYLLLFLIPALTFCATKKSIDQKSETASVVTETSQTGIARPLWLEISSDQYKRVLPPNARMPKRFRMFSLDSLTMKNFLSKSVKQNQWLKGNHDLIIEFPKPDTGFSGFSVYETSTMDSALAAHYPNLKTYGGQEIKDPSESVRFDFNENGFNAYVTGQNGEWFIQPLIQGLTHQYLMIFYKKDLSDSARTPFELPDSLRPR